MIGSCEVGRADRSARAALGPLAGAIALVFAAAVNPGAAVADPAPAAGPAEADAANGSEDLGEVVVTARKRSERLIDVPVAVVALDSKSIEEQGVYSLVDLAQATPGLSADTAISGSGRSDRSFNEYIIRGMTPSSFTNSTVTVFIDGAPFPSGQVSGLDDLERVEVLEGPQSAYFGRETFAGAINLVTRDPSNSFGASGSLLIGSRNWEDARLSLEGPIVPDMLTARLSLRYFTRDGSWENEAAGDKTSQTLGDQSTRSGNLEILFKPVEDLKVKGMFMYWQDRDGPAASGYLFPSQNNCPTGNGLTFFCGQAPALLGNTPATNDVVDPFIQKVLATGAAYAKGFGFSLPFPDQYGLNRNADFWSINAEYHLPALGVTVSSLTAGDTNKWAELSTLDNVDTSSEPNPLFGVGFGQSFFNFPFWVGQNRYDFSQELRITSEPDKAFRWMIGGNYASSHSANVLGGLEFNLTFPGSVTATATSGVFYALAYDFNKQITLNFEGRYQRDEQSQWGLAVPASTAAPIISAVYNDFVPRVSLQYKFTPDVMGYATYSQGINPGTFNGLTPFYQQYIAANYPGFSNSNIVSPEKLKNYELGLKGKFLDGTLVLSADVYYDLWTNQITTGGVLIPVTAGSSTLNLVQVDTNGGESTIDGLEMQVDWTPIPSWTFHFAGALNNSRITSGEYAQAAQIAYGTTKPTAAEQTFNGNQLPASAKIQTSAGVQYNWVLGGLPDWNWFARFDDNYKSKQYMDQANRVYAPALNFANLRVGASAHGMRIEAFVDNLFDEKQVTNIIPFPYEGSNNPPLVDNTLVAGLPYKLAYGLRLSYKFGAAK